MRFHFDANAQHAEASTYGAGNSTSIITPSSGTCPPNRLQISPCPVSCTSLVTTKTTASQLQFAGEIALSNPATRFPQCGTTR